MPEAEDVIADAARHTAVYIHALWRRHRPPHPRAGMLRLPDAARRLHLLAAAVFGRDFRLRASSPPAPPTWLARLVHRGQAPASPLALPATDDADIWLPADFGLDEPEQASMGRYRVLLLQQAMRAVRGSAAGMPHEADAAVRTLYLLCEADAADAALARLLPGLAPELDALRAATLSRRPPLPALRPELQPIEALLRALLAAPAGDADPATPARSLQRAKELAAQLPPGSRTFRGRLLTPDWWCGELRPPGPCASAPRQDADAGAGDDVPTRSARLPRQPRVRQPGENEDDDAPMGPSMVQTAEPQQKAEDPLGLQRPLDREEGAAAEELADALSELDEARLVATPGTPQEVLTADDPPAGHARVSPAAAAGTGTFRYPEWDWRRAAYLDPGTTVHVRPAPPGDPAWVEHTLARRAGLLGDVRRRFELLRARRQRLHAQLDGDDVDLQAWLDAQADVQAGLPLSQRLYAAERHTRRDLAVTLLVDVSGSTDGWVAPHSRVIDVEREALLLVCTALDTLGERFSVRAFSGAGPHGVTVADVKTFAAPFDAAARLRIAGLEPDRYTRAGAALRHAATGLMAVPAAHRLLLLLSDGKPNDQDGYDGPYGIEDMRQAVIEARLQGIRPFCLTVDHAGPAYLPRIFGAGQYGLLPRTELMPALLLDWLRRLVSA
ncbi:nitric oxide reductase NorD protein [Pseudoduganella flava]|uniref:Nitric oxide reductase NorD protein n=1 Tax=Pseudoduganella flava TaxID=871742 RepID=A0A562PZZ3_9BURK|nr:hypothetical protein [Pseudoduganella flava]QGZ38480.1 hypothetical protein GO485_05035 [Pseudoduganella flava]TWI49968.1 nitric oxide reductase NorD protein [Pseudoduganella flava]